MENFETLTEAISALRSEGYTEDFNLQEKCIACRSGSIQVTPDQFQIDKTFRFEGDTNPDDEMILYAISSDKLKLKGLLVNAYGIYSESMSDELANKLHFRK